jgi:hypothetical protein
MTGEVEKRAAFVPIDGGNDVTITPGTPWPSSYRGSKYSLVDSQKADRDKVVRWSHRNLQAWATPPDRLQEVMQSVGKSFGNGKGSFRVTAGREVLTKVHADSYPNAHKAPHADGWIPVFLGILKGDMGFHRLNNDPAYEAPTIWDGLPFNHGETWAVGVDDKLIWKHGGFRFYSAFDHPELIEMYEQYRKIAGRLYINEHGHIWINVPTESVPESRRGEIVDLFEAWRERAEREGKDAALRLVTQRLKATSPDDNPMNGHMPLYIGHLDDFDDGVIPRPVVTDATYYVSCSQTDTEVAGT